MDNQRNFDDQESTRREFLGFLGGAACAASAAALPSGDGKKRRNPHPYEKVDWEHCHRIQGASHIHATNQKILTHVYDSGLRFLTFSNYYPSAPYYPLARMRRGQFRPRQEHAVMRNGKRVPGPIDWNDLISDPQTGWLDEIEENYRKQLPFKVGDANFPNLPKGVCEAPNAEHHSFADCRSHINGLGSKFASGTFDVRRHYLLEQHGFARGTGMPWKTAFTGMLEGLLLPDGGGITINHPIWSKLKDKRILEMLDFDPRVLGIEVFNHSCVDQRPEKDSSQNEALWDRILKTGRQCFGFFTPDWTQYRPKPWQGRNILLVDEFTTEACLRAYRNGSFYGALLGDKLKIESMEITEKHVSITLDHRARIRLFSEKGEIADRQDTTLHQEFATPPQYLRARIEHESGEVLYTQPTLLGSL